jgi:CheY-like chemotaxis protein
VDDEPATNKLLTAMLQTSGCDIKAVGSATDALELLAEALDRGQPFAILFTDTHMPGMDRQDLIQQARVLGPRIVTVLLSGDGQDDAIGVADLQLQKPYSLAALLNTLDQALALHKRVAH